MTATDTQKNTVSIVYSFKLVLLTDVAQTLVALLREDELIRPARVVVSFCRFMLLPSA